VRFDIFPGAGTADVRLVIFPGAGTADVRLDIFPGAGTADVRLDIFPGAGTVDLRFVKFPEDGKFNVTLVVRLARGAKILEEFIVPSTSLPSTNPDGSVEFNNDTSTCPFSESSPLYRETLVTLSSDVTFIWNLRLLSLPAIRALPVDSLKSGGTSASPTKSVL
ncbi:MAG: hypothetical protein QOC23_09085, partial [Nitrososphaeraceae archaeon]|nr:hypothetical protein [Nitrososphaeraceae archaeon]